jgi:glycine cleavage system H protein
MTMPGDALDYRRAGFRTRLPVAFRYTLAHAWLGPVANQPGHWRVGLTRFALRLLGEPVELRFESAAGQPVSAGQALGTFEGFKAISDLVAPAAGRFLGANPALADGLEPLARDPHAVWLYELADVAAPADACLDAEAYAHVLDLALSRFAECRLEPPDD